MRRRFSFLVLSMLLAGCQQAAPDDQPHETPTVVQRAPSTSWSTRAQLPVARTEVTCAGDEGRIFALGGFTEQNVPIGELDIYDMKANAWRRGADFPLGVHHTGLVMHKGSLYVFGGYTGLVPFVGLSLIYRYDPTANTWTQEGSLPRARGGHATILLGDDVYLAGGAPQQPGQEIYKSVDVYNLSTKKWRIGPELAASKEHMAGAAAKDTLVVAGGRRMTLTNLNTTETLTQDAAKWSMVKPMPTARGGIAASAWEHWVVFVGGERSGGTFDEAEAYDVVSGEWSSFAKMPHPRHGLCAVPLEDGIHVVGGGPQAGLSVSAHHEVLSIRTS